MFNNARFTIRSKILVGFFAVVVFLGAYIFSLNGRITAMQDEIDFITGHDMDVHRLADQVVKDVLDMETGQRGFAINGNESYLEPYDNGKSLWRQDYEKLYQLVSDNPNQQRNLDTIKANVEKWIEIAGDYAIKLRKDGNMAELQSFFGQDDVGKGLVDDIRARMDSFRDIERQLTTERVAQLDRRNTDLKNSIYIVFIVVIAFSVIIAFIISGSIVKTIKKVIDSIENIRQSGNALGSQRIDVRTLDEVKDLAEATNRLLDSQEEQNWLQSGIADTALSLQGFDNDADLARAFLLKMADLLGASSGVFYYRRGQRLIRTANLASSEGSNEAGPSEIRMGVGLIGRCAEEKRTISVRPVPDDHEKIHSGLGEWTPGALLILPLTYEGETVGVAEFATFESFAPLQLRLAEQARDAFGIVLNNVESQMEVRRLLEQSQELTSELQQHAEELQAQSEELMTQQDELKASNDALKLSEERLQRQQEELERTNSELHTRSEQVERQVRKTEEINEQVEEQNAILAKQASDLSTASRYKSEFLANMSHELRTPLNSLLILSEMLTENREGNLYPKQVEFARTIHSSGSDLLRLIDEILDLSKVEAGQLRLQVEPVALAEIREVLQRGFDPIAGTKRVDLRFEADPGLPETIRTDGQRLQQILKNLLSNAFKFTFEGHVKLRMYRATSLLPAGKGAFATTDAVAFAVEDSGIGIPAEKQELIFEAFQQADGSTSRKFGGTGLGLTISRELAALIGGKIDIESREGRGSTFTLFVPLLLEEGAIQAAADTEAPLRALPARFQATRPYEDVLAPSIAIPAAKPHADPDIADDREAVKAGDRTLLIVEDDVNFARILLDAARARGFKGIVATQGDQGLALAHAFKPDAIMLDIQLPVIDGWSVLERLKHHPETRHIPVHIVSVVDEPQQGLTMGAMAYLKKPANSATIENALTHIESFMDRGIKRLLIVEDDDALRQSMVELIGHSDVAITAVSTGKEALDSLNSEPFDCIVMDLGLGDISGFQLLDRIRRTETLKAIPIIIYTGKDLSMKEEIELKKYAESIIIKNVKSQERLFDETALFLHRVEANLPEERRNILKKLYNNEVAFEGKRLLLVEDDIRNIFALTNVLESYNMKVSFAENGREALDLLNSGEEFDLILMDIMMPEMDGYEAMKAIRAMPRFESLPIIALTAKAMKEDRQLCLDAGASDYISKPIDVEKLLSLLKVWLYA